MHISIENSFLRLVDRVFDRRPQPMPSAEKLQQCKIISHRGEHHVGPIKENTLAAFDKALQAGVWGIELDVRWTRDGVPVVAHDADMHRLYGEHCDIARTTYSDLKARFPGLAALDEVVARFGRRVHLMIEIKQQAEIDLSRQDHLLAEALRPLQPRTDYHLLALDAQILALLSQTPPVAKVPIAYYLPDRFSKWVIQNQWGGLCGHYLMMRRTTINAHQKHGQQLGTGFANSPNTLLRELNRGINWIFSNNAARLQAFVDARSRNAQ
jgi:glycerophosphoryl diester phosphodiesterase